MLPGRALTDSREAQQDNPAWVIRVTSWDVTLSSPYTCVLLPRSDPRWPGPALGQGAHAHTCGRWGGPGPRKAPSEPQAWLAGRAVQLTFIFC